MKYVEEMLNESEFLKTLRDNNSALIIDVGEDGSVAAKLRVEKTEYIFGTKEIEGGGTIEPMIFPLISPEGKKVSVHVIPFNGVNILK